MKKLILSVLYGLIVGLMYLGLMMTVMVPFLILVRTGFIEVLNGNSTVASVVTNMIGSVKDITGTISVNSIVIIIGQVVLFALLSTVLFLFMRQVMKVFLYDDGYFRHLYEGIFIAVLIIPEVLMLLSAFFNFPAFITVFIIVGITILVVVFAIIMANKVLPDLAKNNNKKYLLNTNTKE